MKAKLVLLIVTTFIGVLFLSCDKDKPIVPLLNIDENDKSFNIDDKEFSKTVLIRTNIDKVLSKSNSSWCKINIDKKKITITVEANPTADSRKAIMTISVKTISVMITITQKGADKSPPKVIKRLSVVPKYTEMFLSWANPNDLDYSYSNLSYSLDGNIHVVKIPKKLNKINISDLKMGQKYIFSFQSFDTSGNSSKVISITTSTLSSDFISTKKVSQLGATPGDVYIDLSWVNPVYQNFNYISVTYLVAGSTKTLVVEKNINTLRINNLTPETEYQFEIRTLDVNDNSFATVKVTKSTTKVDNNPPAIVENFIASVGETFVDLSWKNPSDLDFDHVLITYSLNSVIMNEIVAKNITSSKIQNLTSGNEYLFSIVAVDVKGNKSQVVKITKTTLEDTTPPSKVTNINAKVTAMSVALSWNNPTDNDFVSTSILYTINGVEQNLVVGKNKNSIIINNLAQNTKIDFSLVTTDFTGNISLPVTYSATTLIDNTPPGDVTNLVAIPNSTSIIINWTNPKESEDYNIEISIDDLKIIINNGISSYTFKNLNQNQLYTIAVTTTDLVGNRSNTVKVKSTTLREILIDKTNWTGKANSESVNEGANGKVEKVFDNDINTYWHTEWSGQTVPVYPHYFIIDLKQNYRISTFELVRRQGRPRAGGTKFQMYGGTAENNMILLGTYNFNVKDPESQKYSIDIPNETRYIKYLTLEDTYTGDTSTSMAEITLYQLSK